jgi:hypothetical protein
MNTFQPDEVKPLDREQAGVIANARRLMLVSGLATMLGIFVVIGVIGYRVLRSEDSVVELTSMLPRDAKFISGAVAGDRIVVTIQIAGQVEIRTFDVKTLREKGRLRFSSEP